MNRRTEPTDFHPFKSSSSTFYCKSISFLETKPKHFLPTSPSYCPSNLHTTVTKLSPSVSDFFSPRSKRTAGFKRADSNGVGFEKKKLLMRRTYPIFVNHIWRKRSNVEKNRIYTFCVQFQYLTNKCISMIERQIEKAKEKHSFERYTRN